MGLKSFDCARLSQKRDCAEFLLVFEASIAVSGELISARSKQEALENESAELKGYFKDVLGISKKLAKDREDMRRELNRLYEAMMELHNNMTMEIQVNICLNSAKTVLLTA